MEVVNAQPKVEKCGHFSIRGFAAEVRKKDIKTSWPFPCEDRVDVLPPIRVPDFKYWKCKNCLEIAHKDSVEEIKESFALQRNGTSPSDSCSHHNVRMPPSGVVEILLLRSQQALKEKTLEAKMGSVFAPEHAIDLQVGAGLDDHSQDKIIDGQILVNACATVNMNDVAKNTLTRKIYTEDKSQKTPSKRCFEWKSASASIKQCIEAGKKRMLCVDIPEKEAADREGDDVAAVNSRPVILIGDVAGKNVNEETSPLEGPDDIVNNSKEAVVSPKSISGQRKGKEIKDGSIRKPRTKKLHPNKHKLPRLKTCLRKSMTDEVTHLDNPKDDTVNAAAVHKSEDSDRLTSEDENHVSPLGGTGKRKRIKLRTLGNIMSRCGETCAGSSSSGSGASLGIDLNLSPTHQIIKTKKRKDMGDEDEEFLPTSSQDNGPVILENSAGGNQHTATVNDQTVSSRKKKGKMLHNENGDSSSLTSQGDRSGGVQTENEYGYVQSAGTTTDSFRQTKGVCNGKDQYSYPETPSAGVENVRKKDKIVNGKLPSLLPENPAKKLNILKKRSGQRGKGACKQNHNSIKEQTSLDDITMEIVELMAKNKLERRLGASEVNNCSSEVTTSNRNDLNQTNKTEEEILKFLQEKKSQQSKLQATNEGRDCMEPKRQGSAKSIQPVEYISRASSRPCTINSLSERAHAFNIFTNSQEKSFSGAPSPTGISSRNCGNQTLTSSKNWGSGASQAPYFGQISNREVSYQNSIFSPNQEKPSNGAQLFLGASSSNRNCDYQIPTFSKDQDRPLTAAQNHVPSPSKTSGQSFMFSQNYEKPPRRSQLHASNSTRKFTDLLIGSRYPEASLQTSDAYQSQTLPWKNPPGGDQRAWPPIMSSCLPSGNCKTRKFDAQLNTGSKMSQYLELFPRGNKNGNQSVKPVDAARRAPTPKQLVNHIDERNRNFDFQTCRTQQEYPFSGRERGLQFNPHSVRPVDLYNKESIPATDLLRLMDAGMCPSAPVNVDKSHNLSQQCLSCPDHCQLEMSRFGHIKNDEAFSRPSITEFLTRNHYGAGSFSRKFPSTPETNRATSSAALSREGTVKLQNSETMKMGPWLRTSFPETVEPHFPNDPTKVKARAREAQSQSKRSRFDISLSENHTSGTNHGSALNLNRQKGFLTSPASKPSPTKSLALEDSNNCLKSKEKDAGTIDLPKISCRDGVCSMNRNPAEFTVPEAGNEYMTGYEDVKNKEKNLSKEKTDPVELAGNKRQKKVRFAALKDM